MDKYKELRKLYGDAGVKIYGLRISPTADITDDEMDYVFNAAAATGATHVTLEVTDDVPFQWTMPATIELEYEVPRGSDAVKEVAKCLQYCRAALA